MKGVLDDGEIQAIIERVKSRVAAADFAGRTGPALAAADSHEIGDAQLGDGVHANIDAAVAAARVAFEA